MKEEKKVFAVLAGVFLLLYTVVLFLEYLLLFQFSLEELPSLAWAVLLIVTALLLILCRVRKAAATMGFAVVACWLMNLHEIPKYFGPQGYQAFYDPEINYAEFIPGQYVLVPVLAILAMSLFGAALWLRGWVPFGMMLAAGAAEYGEMVLQIMSIGYITGHPWPGNLYPLLFSISAFFAGLYLLSRKPKARDSV